MKNGKKSSNLVKSHELICNFIVFSLVILPPYPSTYLKRGQFKRNKTLYYVFLVDLKTPKCPFEIN